jgi:hypothetical protein
MQGPSGLRSFVTQRPMGAWRGRRPAVVSQSGLASSSTDKFKLADVRDPSLSSTDTICQGPIASVSFGDAYLADQKVVLIRRGQRGSSR